VRERVVLFCASGIPDQLLPVLILVPELFGYAAAGSMNARSFLICTNVTNEIVFIFCRVLINFPPSLDTCAAPTAAFLSLLLV
jgi:hypothetical protein